MGETGDCKSITLGNVELCACTAVVLFGDGVGPGVMVVKFPGLADSFSVFACNTYISHVRDGSREPLTAEGPDMCRFRGRKVYL